MHGLILKYDNTKTTNEFTNFELEGWDLLLNKYIFPANAGNQERHTHSTTEKFVIELPSTIADLPGEQVEEAIENFIKEKISYEAKGIRKNKTTKNKNKKNNKTKTRNKRRLNKQRSKRT